MHSHTQLPTLGIAIVMNNAEEAALVAASVSVAVMRVLQISAPRDFLPYIRSAARYVEPVDHQTLHVFTFSMPVESAAQLPQSVRALFISSCRSWHRAPRAAASFERFIDNWLLQHANQAQRITRSPVVISNPNIAVFQKIEAVPYEDSVLESVST